MWAVNEPAHMKSLSSCINKLVVDGFNEDFKATDRGLTSVSDGKHYFPEEISILNFFRFEGYSDPENNSILYAIETSDGRKGTLVDAYGTYADPRVTHIVQQIESIQKKTNKTAAQEF